MSENLSAVRSARTISLATIASRILGFVRDMLMAAIFGTTLYTDSFLVAYRIPNLMRRLFGEGALNSSFIPVFVKTRKESPEKAQNLASNTFWVLFVTLIIISVLGVIFSEQIVGVMTFSFSDTQSADLTSGSLTSGSLPSSPLPSGLAVKLTKIMFPYVLFICLAALGMGYLNSFNSFFIPALSPILLNIAMIIYLFFFGTALSNSAQDMEAKCFGLAWAVIAGGILQFGIHLRPMIKKGFTFRHFTAFKDPGLKQVIFLMAPATIGLAVTQLNIFVDTVIAWQLGAGAVSALYFSNRLVQLPLAVFGIAISTAFLPRFSRAAATSDKKELIDAFSYALRAVMFITIPAAVGLITAGKPIIELLFMRGRFDLSATIMTDKALVCYALGLFFFAAVNLTVKIFYSLESPKAPVKASIYAMILNVFLNLILMIPLKHAGLALATSISSFFNFLILLKALRIKLGKLNGRELLNSILRISASSFIMGISVYMVRVTFPFSKALLSGRILFVGLLIIVGILTYWLSVKLLGCPELKIFQSLIMPSAKKFNKSAPNNSSDSSEPNNCLAPTNSLESNDSLDEKEKKDKI